MNNIGKVRAFLTEFVLVILFFSLSAVIVLQLFLKANDKSELSKNKTMAYMVAEQTAEKIKAEAKSEGLLAEELKNMSGGWYDKEWSACDKDEAQFVLSVSVSEETTGSGVLMHFAVTVSKMGAEDMLCELPVTIYCPVAEGGEA